MNAGIGILIPSLNRPARLSALIQNLHTVTQYSHELHFAVSDAASIAILEELGEHYIVDSGKPPASTFANRVNRLYAATNESFIYLVGDDDEHLDGWDIHMLACMTSRVEVVVSKCNHMVMMTREYIETQSGCVDIPNVVCGPYSHNFVELELISTAKMRGVVTWCQVPTVVHHRHVGNGDCCVGDFDHDETYQRGDDGFAADDLLYQQREAAYFPGQRYW